MANDEHQLNIELCSEVKKHPCLYDINLEDHSRRRMLEQAWTEVAEQVNLSAETCKKRWANLRTVYVRTSKLMSKRGTNSMKAYYLSRHMNFLRPYIKPLLCASPTVSSNEQPKNIFKPAEPAADRHHHQSLESSSISRQHVANIGCVDEIDSMTERSIADDAEEFQNDDDDDESTINHNNDNNNSSQNFIYPSSRRRKKTSSKRVSVIDEALLDYFRFKKQKLGGEAISDSENLRRYFLLSLLPEVDALPEEKFKVFKRRVLTLIDELDVP